MCKQRCTFLKIIRTDGFRYNVKSLNQSKLWLKVSSLNVWAYSWELYSIMSMTYSIGTRLWHAIQQMHLVLGLTVEWQNFGLGPNIQHDNVGPDIWTCHIVSVRPNMLPGFNWLTKLWPQLGLDSDDEAEDERSTCSGEESWLNVTNYTLCFRPLMQDEFMISMTSFVQGHTQNLSSLLYLKLRALFVKIYPACCSSSSFAGKM